MIQLEPLPVDLLDRMERAVEKVRDRLLRVSKALDAANVPYVIVGGNAVGAWVATRDESAVRNTQDVDIILRESDLDRAEAALLPAGFIRRHAGGIDLFLDGPNAKARDAVHVVIAAKKVRSEYVVAAPDVEPFHQHPQFRLLPLELLVQMKLTSYRDKDRTHIRDLVGVGLVDDTWPSRYPPVLAERLKQILDNPEG